MDDERYERGEATLVSPETAESGRPAGRNRSDQSVRAFDPSSQDAGRPANQEGETEAKARPRGRQTDEGFFRRHPIITLVGALLLIGAVVAGGLWWLNARHYETTDDAFIDARQFGIAPKVAGYVVDVPVTDNQTVMAGAPLVRIDDRDYRNALAQAEAQISAAEAAIGNVDAQIAAQQAQVDQAEAQVRQTQAALEFAQAEAKRYRDLAERGAGTIQQAQSTESNLQQQRASLARAQAAVSTARRQLDAVKAQRSSAEATLAQAKAQRDEAALNLSYTVITAAQAGQVVHLSAAKGELVQVGQNLMMFVPSTLWVTANFKETQIADMRPGQPVEISVDAYPGRQFRGHVDSIQPGSGTAFSLLPAENATGNYVKVVQRVPVKIDFDHLPEDIPLGPGMSVVPRVKVR
jgi:membrane fusion protein (multidrug efflux system)